MKSIHRFLRTLTASAALGMAGLCAHAAPVNVTVSGFNFIPGDGYGIDSNEDSGTQLGVTFTSTFTTQSFVLTNAGDFSTFDVGSVVFSEPSRQGGITNAETDELGVIAALTFTSPFGSIIKVLAAGTATVGATNDDAVDLIIDWSPVTVSFGGGGSLGISLADLSFTGKPELPQTLAQSATITLLAVPTDRPTAQEPQSVPEPGTLALAASALAMLGGARLRRRA